MNMRRAFLAWLALLSPVQLSADTVIYDNTTYSTQISVSTGMLVGDEVVAAGTARRVTRLELGVYSQRHIARGDFQAWLFANDGTGGAPGTMLWQSSILDNYALTGGFDLIPFTVPSVLVPNRFTWAIQTTDYSPVAVATNVFGPPTIGEGTPDYAWFGGPNSWTHVGRYNGVPMDLMARITASEVVPDIPDVPDVPSVPEPGTAILSSLAVALLACRSKRGRSSFY
jgi:hypothetical protein